MRNKCKKKQDSKRNGKGNINHSNSHEKKLYPKIYSSQEDEEEFEIFSFFLFFPLRENSRFGNWGPSRGDGGGELGRCPVTEDLLLVLNTDMVLPRPSCQQEVFCGLVGLVRKTRV